MTTFNNLFTSDFILADKFPRLDHINNTVDAPFGRSDYKDRFRWRKFSDVEVLKLHDQAPSYISM